MIYLYITAGVASAAVLGGVVWTLFFGPMVGIGLGTQKPPPVKKAL